MIQLNKYETAATYFFLMLNPLDSQKTKLLKDKIVDFSTNNKQFSLNHLKKKPK